MLEFYTTEDCPECREILELLTEISLAHKVIVSEGNDSVYLKKGGEYRLPFIIDDDQIIQGMKNIRKHLQKLEAFKTEWDRFQSDSCYCSGDGGIE